MSSLVLLNGAPGVGKSSVADQLADDAGGLALHGDQVRAQIFTGDGSEQKRDVFIESGQLASKALQAGTPLVVFEYLFERQQLNLLLSSHQSCASIFLFTLSASLEIIQLRDSQREHPLGAAAVADLYHLLPVLGTVIQTGDSSIAEVADTITHLVEAAERTS